MVQLVDALKYVIRSLQESDGQDQKDVTNAVSVANRKPINEELTDLSTLWTYKTVLDLIVASILNQFASPPISRKLDSENVHFHFIN